MDMQQAFDEWCPYKGSPDPWAVWQAAWAAAESKSLSKVDKIVKIIDESTMLGAAWDCLSEAAKTRFKKKFQEAIDDSSGSPMPDTV